MALIAPAEAATLTSRALVSLPVAMTLKPYLATFSETLRTLAREAESTTALSSKCLLRRSKFTAVG